MALKICKECGEEISSDAKVCPKCGKIQKASSSVKHPVLIVIIVLIFLGMIISVGTSGSIKYSNSIGTGSSTSVPAEKFTLVSSEMTGTDYSAYIEGEIRNNTNKKYSYVKVSFTLYDENGAQLGSAIDSINNLEPNGTWKYKAIAVTTENIGSFKLNEITGW